MNKAQLIELLLAEGESDKTEFKESVSDRLDKSFVGFANASGGSIWIGVTDTGQKKGVTISNQLKSKIYDLARNCDPSVGITIISYKEEKLLEIQIKEGSNKPYSCKSGFYLRIGPSTQKLKRDEIVKLISHTSLISHTGQFHFDEQLNPQFEYPKDFSNELFSQFLSLSSIHVNASVEDILQSLNLGKFEGDIFKLTNAAILFFAKEPHRFLKESYVTCVRYQGSDRFQIIDKLDCFGSLPTQIEEACTFFKRHISKPYHIVTSAQREEVWEYPFVAFREAIINAVTHRDYFYDHTHTYVHIFDDRIEIENPGGLLPGILIEDLGKRSVRRNSLIANLLHRARYSEGVGSGIDRIRGALKRNGNPEFIISASNFFVIQFHPLKFIKKTPLSFRQSKIVTLLQSKGTLSKKELTSHIGTSDDTLLRELNKLIDSEIVVREGEGKATIYRLSGQLNLVL